MDASQYDHQAAREARPAGGEPQRQRGRGQRGRDQPQLGLGGVVGEVARAIGLKAGDDPRQATFYRVIRFEQLDAVELRADRSGTSPVVTVVQAGKAAIFSA